MRGFSIGAATVHFDPPEAGRYDARLLIFPGLFQSYRCWRPFTSMLAHRGWEVFFLGRDESEPGKRDSASGSGGGILETASSAIERLGEKCILLGADLGAALALELCRERRPLALVLLAPSRADHLLARLEKSAGWFGRRGLLAGEAPALEPPGALARACANPADLASGSRPWVRELAQREPATTAQVKPPPSIVFAPEGDPLVETEHALSFADGRFARASGRRLSGRWWPSTQGPEVADEVHRFLILTLADRVVDFPEEILEGES